MKKIIINLVPLAAILLCAGCAFDVSHVSQTPSTFTPASEAHSFLLIKEVKASLGTGYPTVLKAGTGWNRVGATESGEVYSTKDQIVKVEASNIYEAYLVVSNSSLVGFYLPVEKTMATLSRPIPLETKSNP